MQALLQIWRSRELRNKILFTLAILAFVRLIAHIPLPEIDRSQLLGFLNRSENQVLGVLSLFTGSALSTLSINLMGVGPYITASIIIQLLTKMVPSWEALSKEGQQGREKLNQYSRYLTVPMAFLQGYGMLAILKSQGVLFLDGPREVLTVLTVMTASSILVMWLGEMISERGIGNGVSLIIALGIIASAPQQIGNTISILEAGQLVNIVLIALAALATVLVVVIMNDAERRVPITYARNLVGPRPVGLDTYLPIRVNTAGVIPIIFALSFLTFPQIVAQLFLSAKSPFLVSMAETVNRLLQNNSYYALIYFLLILVFTFFYTYIIFEPKQTAENLQKRGGFIIGVRPGTETKQYLSYIISRVTLIGALFLAIIAVFPILLQQVSQIQTLIIGGTSVLIVVSVIIETNRQLAGQLTMRRYDAVTAR